MDNGVLDDDNIETGITLTFGAFHELKIHDSNGDQAWSFAYDGHALGDKSLSLVWGLSVTESERGCTADSMYAHFKSLNKCNNIGCGWVNYGGLTEYIDEPSGNGYNFCWQSPTRYDVYTSC